MFGRGWTRLLAASICAAVACGDGGSSEADAGTPGAGCFDDYVVFAMGVINPDAGFVEIENGDDLAVTFMPTGLTAAILAIHARGVDATRAELTVELVADGEAISISQGATGNFVEAPLGYEWPQVWLIFEQFPDAYVGQTLSLRGRITDYCERTGSAERTVTLVDGR